MGSLSLPWQACPKGPAGFVSGLFVLYIYVSKAVNPIMTPTDMCATKRLHIRQAVRLSLKSCTKTCNSARPVVLNISKKSMLRGLRVSLLVAGGASLSWCIGLGARRELSQIFDTDYKNQRAAPHLSRRRRQSMARLAEGSPRSLPRGRSAV